MKNPGLYILTNTVNGMQYVGKDSNLPSRSKEHLSGKTPQCPRIHNAIKKYGADTFCAEIIQYPGISQEALNAKGKITRCMVNPHRTKVFPAPKKPYRKSVKASLNKLRMAHTTSSVRSIQ